MSDITTSQAISTPQETARSEFSNYPKTMQAFQQEALTAMQANLVNTTATILEGILSRQSHRLQELLEDIKAEWEAIQKWDSIRRG